MSARIFQPARNAMQSGKGKSDNWVLQFEQEKPRSTEPLMGWTSSSDMKQQIKLRFDSKEDAIAYATREGLAYRVAEQHTVKRQKRAYADNFKFGRATNWTH